MRDSQVINFALKSEVDDLFNQCYLKDRVPQLQHEFRKSYDNLTALIENKFQQLSGDISVINNGLEQYCNKSNLDQIITNLVNKFTASFVPQKDYIKLLDKVQAIEVTQSDYSEKLKVQVKSLEEQTNSVSRLIVRKAEAS